MVVIAAELPDWKLQNGALLNMQVETCGDRKCVRLTSVGRLFGTGEVWPRARPEGLSTRTLKLISLPVHQDLLLHVCDELSSCVRGWDYGADVKIGTAGPLAIAIEIATGVGLAELLSAGPRSARSHNDSGQRGRPGAVRYRDRNESHVGQATRTTPLRP